VVTPSARALELAGRIGTRAGDTYRETGVTQRDPFKSLPDLSRAWVLAYVDTAYKSST
jgi:hypothetical protein